MFIDMPIFICGCLFSGTKDVFVHLSSHSSTPLWMFPAPQCQWPSGTRCRLQAPRAWPAHVQASAAPRAGSGAYPTTVNKNVWVIKPTNSKIQGRKISFKIQGRWSWSWFEHITTCQCSMVPSPVQKFWMNSSFGWPGNILLPYVPNTWLYHRNIQGWV